MSHRDQMRLLVKEAELYRKQGLLEESKGKYLEVLRLVKRKQPSKDKCDIEKVIEGKVLGLDKEIAATHQDTRVPQLPDEVRSLIKKLFAFSRHKDAAAIEGAVALARFGQYDKALEESNRLLAQGIFPLVAAKNILRCHLALSSPETAVNQFREWLSGDLFSKEQLTNIRSFLGHVLSTRDIKADLPEVVGGSSEESDCHDDEESLMDISSISIKVQNGPRKGKTADLDVTFQSGDVISLILSAKDQDLVDIFTPGIQLQEVYFYSPMALFRGSGTVTEKKRIKTGPKRGDYILNVAINSI